MWTPSWWRVNQHAVGLLRLRLAQPQPPAQFGVTTPRQCVNSFAKVPCLVHVNEFDTKSLREMARNDQRGRGLPDATLVVGNSYDNRCGDNAEPRFVECAFG
jgi:hypothetical protein